MKLTVITLFPDLIRNYLNDALLAKAISQNKLEVQVISLRDHAEGNYKSVDEIPFGGGDGMVIKADVLEKALTAAQSSAKHVIYLSPQGKPWNQAKAQVMATEAKEFILICGRYAGIDQRFIHQYVDEEISIGDYVLSGGELAALVLIESISRFIPGVLGDQQSACNDSFADGLLEAPQFTRPAVWQDLAVPAVLMSGNHQKIADWKKFCSYLVTKKKRPDLLSTKPSAFQGIDEKKAKEFYASLSPEEKNILDLEDLQL